MESAGCCERDHVVGVDVINAHLSMIRTSTITVIFSKLVVSYVHDTAFLKGLHLPPCSIWVDLNGIPTGSVDFNSHIEGWLSHSSCLQLRWILPTLAAKAPLCSFMVASSSIFLYICHPISNWNCSTSSTKLSNTGLTTQLSVCSCNHHAIILYC
jgi:hypothetical protein